MWDKKRNLIKKAVLYSIGVIFALTWSQSGQTQGPCTVLRGIDPLDVVNSGVRHNVWILLDTSGSMGEDFGGGQSKLQVAKDVLTQLMTVDLIDASAGGAPLVNWGFTHFANNQQGDLCAEQFWAEGVNCAGLDANSYHWPPGCAGEDNRSAIIAALNATNDGGFTPNGRSLEQLSQRIVEGGYVDNLYDNQRNFIIIVTDGDDTCECNSLVWDGATDPLLRSGNNPNSAPTLPVTTGADAQAYNAGLKARRAFARLNGLNPDDPPLGPVTGTQGNVFVIGMGLGGNSPARANHLAWEASGAAYGNTEALSALFANDPQGLRNRLREVFARIGVVENEFILGTTVVGSVWERIPDIPGLELNGSPVTTDDVLWDGIDLQDARLARSLRGDLDNNVVFSTSVTTPGFKGRLKAVNAYTVSDYGTQDELRTIDTADEDVLIEQGGSLLWDAGEILQQRDPDDRTILFHQRDGTLGLFEVTGDDGLDEDLADLLGVDQHYLSEFDPTGNGAASKADAARIVIHVIRGYRLVTDPVYGFYNPADPTALNFSTLDAEGNPTWKLLDPTRVGAAVVQNPPRSPDLDPPQHNASEYGLTFPDGFYWDRLNRQTVVYLGTNGGVMHAFRGYDGEELYAYIPADILGDWEAGEIPDSRNTLRDLVALLVAENNGVNNHRYFIAGSATVEDVFLQSDGAWHTALAFGRGKGGKFITSLDVSDVGDWIPNSPSYRLDPVIHASNLPGLIFNVGNRQGISDLYDGLGETWSLPVMGNVLSATGDQWVLFVGGGYGCEDPSTSEGQWLYVLRMEDGSVLTRFQALNDTNAPIPWNGLVAAPRRYNPSLEDPALLDQRDYTSRIYISDLQGRVYKLDCYHADPNQWTFEVFYEMGLNQPVTTAAAIKKLTGQQTVLVYVGSGGDGRVDPATTRFQVAAIVDNDQEGANTAGSTDPPGWMFEIAEGERVIADPVVGGNFVFFATTWTTLNLEECIFQFFSNLYAVGATSGLGVFDLDIDTAGIDNPLALGEGKVTGLFFRDEHLYVSRSGGLETQGETMVLGTGEFEPPEGGVPPGTVQVLVRGFRISPF